MTTALVSGYLKKSGAKNVGRLKKVFFWFYNPSINALRDYKDVFVEAGKSAKLRPIKSLIYGGIGTGITYCAYKSPSLAHFDSAALENHHRLLMLSLRLRNPCSEEYINRVRQLVTEKRLGYRNLGIISLLYQTHSNKELKEFSAVFLSPRWVDYADRIVDVGFLGSWYYMDQAMRDYDINDQEWKTGP